MNLGFVIGAVARAIARRANKYQRGQEQNCQDDFQFHCRSSFGVPRQAKRDAALDGRLPPSLVGVLVPNPLPLGEGKIATEDRRSRRAPNSSLHLSIISLISRGSSTGPSPNS